MDIQEKEDLEDLLGVQEVQESQEHRELKELLVTKERKGSPVCQAFLESLVLGASLGLRDPQDPVDFQVKRVCPFLDQKVWMVLLVKMVSLDRKEKGDILGLEEFLEILRKELLAFQGRSDPLENPAGMEHQANVASQVHLVIRVK